MRGEKDRENNEAGDTGTGYHGIRRWKYFPHVDSRTMKERFCEKLEALQGRSRTYLAGEVMSFSTVEQSERYLRALAQRFF